MEVENSNPFRFWQLHWYFEAIAKFGYLGIDLLNSLPRSADKRFFACVVLASLFLFNVLQHPHFVVDKESNTPYAPVLQ